MANISKEVEGKAPEEVGMPVDVVLPIFLFKPPISFVFFSFSFFLFSFSFFSLSLPQCLFLSKVKRYWKVFWDRNEELQDLERIMSIIDKGEQKIQRKKDIKRALDAKVEETRETLYPRFLYFLFSLYFRWLDIVHHFISYI